MFNDRFGLTEAVLAGRKTMTRRIIKGNFENVKAYHANGGWHYIADTDDGDSVELKPNYTECEEVWIAQSYQSLGYKPDDWIENIYGGFQPAHELAGYTNKMFVRSLYLEHRVRISGVRVERLQDISDEDCLKEGIILDDTAPSCYKPFYTFPNSVEGGTPVGYETPRMAFAKLIDFVSHGSVWDSNPWVYVYTFKLIDMK